MGNRIGCLYVINFEYVVFFRVFEKGILSIEVGVDLVYEVGGKVQVRKWKIDIFYQVYFISQLVLFIISYV